MDMRTVETTYYRLTKASGIDATRLGRLAVPEKSARPRLPAATVPKMGQTRPREGGHPTTRVPLAE